MKLFPFLRLYLSVTFSKPNNCHGHCLRWDYSPFFIAHPKYAVRKIRGRKHVCLHLFFPRNIEEAGNLYRNILSNAEYEAFYDTAVSPRLRNTHTPQEMNKFPNSYKHVLSIYRKGGRLTFNHCTIQAERIDLFIRTLWVSTIGHNRRYIFGRFLLFDYSCIHYRAQPTLYLWEISSFWLQPKNLWLKQPPCLWVVS